jgi:DNA helicase-2/ATP-dependent DNA helicase PcrA
MTPDYDFFLAHLTDCLRAGRGFSVFDADPRAPERFSEQCRQQGVRPVIYQLSAPKSLAQSLPDAPACAIIVQDLPYSDFLSQAATLADRLVFPLWFKRIPICFFSSIGRGAYPENPVQGADLHKNYAQLVNGLLCEQIFSLLERVDPPVAGKSPEPALPAYELEKNLAPVQQQAVANVRGPIRVLAPAGSGKTKTLVNRILHLLNQGIPAEKILALAFNKKARDEMQARLDLRGVRAVEIRTFHSLGYEIVRQGLHWTFDAANYQKTARDLLRTAVRQQTDLPPTRNADPLDAFLDGLRKAKMELAPLANLTVEVGERIYPFEPIFYAYLEQQKGVRFVDFDDMIYLALRALLQNPALRHQYQSQFEFILVDEFQDLNQAQLLLLQILALPENNIFAVGDDDQMIYGFRGAEVRHIIEFDKRFPISASYVLNTNYRSSRQIVRHSGWLIGHNAERIRKDIQPGPEARQGKFEIAGCASLLEQAKFAATWLVEHKRENHLNWRDYAILYRHNAYQFPLAAALDALDIPHGDFSGPRLFQTPAGRDVYAWLQVLFAPSSAHRADFERILKRPNKFFTNQIISQAVNWEAFRRLPEIPTLRDWERDKLREFVSQVERLSGQLAEIPALEALQILRVEFGLDAFYQEQARKSDDVDQASDAVCFEVILALAENYPSGTAFYRFVCRSTDEGDAKTDEANQVYISTIHKAKGKEFRNVVYFNLGKVGVSPAQVEEERRIVYVGATRPKDDLLVTFPVDRPSNFLLELAQNPKFKEQPTELLERTAAECGRKLAKEQFVHQRLESAQEKAVAGFTGLAGGAAQAGLAGKIQLWRINQAERKINQIGAQIRQHQEKSLTPLSAEVAELEEELDLRRRLGLTPVKDDKITPTR